MGVKRKTTYHSREKLFGSDGKINFNFTSVFSTKPPANTDKPDWLRYAHALFYMLLLESHMFQLQFNNLFP